jgi:hypothetical protein
VRIRFLAYLDLTLQQVPLQIAKHLMAIDIIRCNDLDAAWHRNLAIPERAWPGLKQLPEMAGLSVDSQQNYISMVKLGCNLGDTASH